MLARFDCECNQRPGREIPAGGFSLLNSRADRNLLNAQGGGLASLPAGRNLGVPR
jgi:hypothetical protein